MHEPTERSVSRRGIVKSIGAAGLAAAGIGTVSGTGVAAETATGITDGETYKVLNVATSNALDIVGAGTNNGDDAQQYDYVGGASQQWTVQSVGDGYYKLINENSGKALDVASVSTADGATVHQWDYVGGENQQWAIEETDPGVYSLTARHSGKVAEVPAYEDYNGSLVQQWSDGGGQNQRWALFPVGEDTEPDVSLANDDRYESGGVGYVEVDVTNNESSAIALNPTVTEPGTDNVFNPNQPDIVVPAGATRRITVSFTDYDSAGNISLSIGDDGLTLQQVPYLEFPETSA
jgi:hypothetical protein